MCIGIHWEYCEDSELHSVGWVKLYVVYGVMICECVAIADL